MAQSCQILHLFKYIQLQATSSRNCRVTSSQSLRCGNFRVHIASLYEYCYLFYRRFYLFLDLISVTLTSCNFRKFFDTFTNTQPFNLFLWQKPVGIKTSPIPQRESTDWIWLKMAGTPFCTRGYLSFFPALVSFKEQSGLLV